MGVYVGAMIPVSRWRRVGGRGAVTLLGLIGVAACGGADGVAPTSTLAVETTDFATIPPVQTTEPPPTVPPSTLPEPQEYVIESGDFPIAIAETFGVSLQALVSINGWSDVQSDFPLPGATILIPAGGRNPVYMMTTTLPPTSPDATGAPAPESGGAGTYEIQAGDYPIKIAEQFGITLQALAAANGWENLETDFPLPGAVIIIPAATG